MESKIKLDNKFVVLNPDTYCPMTCLPITLELPGEAQHDGRLWSQDTVDYHEQQLYEKIMKDLGVIVKNFITETQPYQSHAENNYRGSDG